jgi:hypothetical protein
MAGLVPAIHVFLACGKDVDARDKPGHDEFGLCALHPEDRKAEDQQDQEDHDEDVEQEAGDVG